MLGHTILQKKFATGIHVIHVAKVQIKESDDKSYLNKGPVIGRFEKFSVIWRLAATLISILIAIQQL